MQFVLHLPTTPTVQGGWTTCARVRRLSMPIACLSSAMAFASHLAMVLAMEWPSAVDGVEIGFRASGAFFAFVRF